MIFRWYIVLCFTVKNFQLKNKSIWPIIRWPLFFVILLWIIELLSVYFDYRLLWLGVIPRTISGIPGIFFSPFIHGNYEHLLSNTLPLLVVGSGLIYFYGEIAKDFSVIVRKRQDMTTPNVLRVNNFLMILFDLF